jgi:Fanconi anemia group M protein
LLAFLNLDLLKKDGLELRDYQQRAAEKAVEKSLLVVMPTALGKTFVAVLAIAHLLTTQKKRILFLAPTKPLALQQASRLRELLLIPAESIVLVTGEIAPAKRVEAYENARIVCGTPQTVEHDVLAGRLRLSDFALAVFDEAHRSVGNYAYVFLGKQAQKHGVLVLGLTASPSSRREKIEEICASLGVRDLEVRTARDEDVKAFVKDVKMRWVFIDLPGDLKELRVLLEEILREPLRALRDQGFLQTAALNRVNKRDLLMLRSKILAVTREDTRAYSALSALAKSLNLVHAIDLLESQGVDALKSFIEGLAERKSKTKAVQSLIADFRVEKIRLKCDALLKAGLEHPKMRKLKEIVSSASAEGKTVIVFAHYRDSVKQIARELNSIAGITAVEFVGRAEGGMTQKKQAEVLDRFRNRGFNVLVATSVGEEGLDIPSVDLVVFYEAVPSEIRLIQRRGRAGRVKAGEAVVLVTKDSKDEAYFWIARRKERVMHEVLADLKKDFAEKENVLPAKEDKQKSLSEYG